MAAPGPVDQIRNALGLPADADIALTELAAVEPGGTERPFVLPSRDEADALFRRLGLSDADRADASAARPDPDRTPELWWLLERCHRMLVQRMGTVGPLTPWPELPPRWGLTGRFVYIWAFVATVPAVRAYHRAHGIDDETSWRILGALSAQLANRRELYGEGGLHTQNWLTHHFRGAIYALGRLHFERLVLPPGDPEPDGPQPGEPVLGLHIPEGRLTPESVDDALAQAVPFFAEHFPAEPYRYAVCTSWVLDPQLIDYLAIDSNIIRFQRRFTLRPPGPADDSATVVEFLFKRPIADLDRLPRATTLQRAVVDHIRAGHPWHFRTGWFPL